MRRLVVRTLQALAARDPVLPWLERKFCAANEVDMPPVFIVGAPRTGSTLLYELLVCQYRVAYFPNVAELAFRSPVLATRSCRRMGMHHAFVGRSRLGVIEGTMAPSEAGRVMRHWLETSTYEETRSMFSRLTRVFGGPVVVKDLDNVMRMERIHGFFPQAVFVHMRRDESSAGESLLAARRAVWGNAHRWLGVRPPDYDLPETADPHAQVAAQIRAIDAHIETMGEQWGSERVVNIQYETLCAHPAAELSRLADALRLLEVPMEANTDAGPVPTGFDFRRESLALVGQ